jgi:hypothetical protein
MQGLFDNIGDVEIFLIGKSDVIQLWYKGGFVIAFAIALFAVAWIFYDSVRKGWEATIWKVISVVSVILVIPSVVLWLYPSLADPNAATTIFGAVDALAYLGIVAGIGGLVSIVCYAAGIGEPAITCPTCGREQDPSWEYCPHCVVPETPTPVEPLTEPEPLVSTETLEREVAIGPVSPAPPDTVVLRPKEVVRLAYLVQTSGMRKGVTHHLGEITNIGRDATDNEIVVDDDTVSRRHAKIKLGEGKFVLYDLATANGTFVNGKQIVKQALMENDAVKMGETTFTFMEVKQKEEA